MLTRRKHGTRRQIRNVVACKHKHNIAKDLGSNSARGIPRGALKLTWKIKGFLREGFVDINDQYHTIPPGRLRGDLGTYGNNP